MYDYNRKLLISFLNNKISSKKLLSLWRTDNRPTKGCAKVC